MHTLSPEIQDTLQDPQAFHRYWTEHKTLAPHHPGMWDSQDPVVRARLAMSLREAGYLDDAERALADHTHPLCQVESKHLQLKRHAADHDTSRLLDIVNSSLQVQTIDSLTLEALAREQALVGAAYQLMHDNVQARTAYTKAENYAALVSQELAHHIEFEFRSTGLNKDPNNGSTDLVGLVKIMQTSQDPLLRDQVRYNILLSLIRITSAPTENLELATLAFSFLEPEDQRAIKAFWSLDQGLDPDDSIPRQSKRLADLVYWLYYHARTSLIHRSELNFQLSNQECQNAMTLLEPSNCDEHGRCILDHMKVLLAGIVENETMLKERLEAMANYNPDIFSPLMVVTMAAARLEYAALSGKSLREVRADQHLITSALQKMDAVPRARTAYYLCKCYPHAMTCCGAQHLLAQAGQIAIVSETGISFLGSDKFAKGMYAQALLAKRRGEKLDDTQRQHLKRLRDEFRQLGVARVAYQAPIDTLHALLAEEGVPTLLKP